MALAPRASSAIAPAAVGVADHTRHDIAVRLLPFLFILYITNYLDRTSVAYAALGMSRDLGFSDRVFGLGAGIFFISYVALQIPGALLVERWSARRSIAAIMIAWGSLTVLTALVHTPGQLYLARFVLGAAEAGFFPGVIVYLSHWFIHEDRAKATSNFMAAIPLSFVLGSPLAGWILGHKWLGVGGWRWLFVLEGLPAILLGSAAFFYLTDWPGQAAWLAPEQRRWIEQKLEEEKPANVRSITVWQAMRSRTVLLLASVTFLNYFVFYSFAFWFPTVLKRQSGLSDVRVGLLGAVPYVAALIGMLINGWHSDRSRERRWHSALPLFIAATGLLGLIRQPGSIPLTVVLFTMVCLCAAYLPAFWAMPTEILSESAAAAGVGMINAVGSVAGFAGPYAFGYLHSRTGSFSYGWALMMVSAFAGGMLILRAPAARQRVSPEPPGP
ncbi:MAG TPA: MFS transporter [Candidatus Acidoferrum sp.]|nr:MFS transporter [Candidatus Acidoferrum sp.]